MVSVREIRSKIMSLQNTKKITKAMEMISAVKMKKWQKIILSVDLYAKKIYKIIDHLLFSRLEYRHPYMYDRDLRSIGYFVVLTDRGLVGSLNINLIKKFMVDIRTLVKNKINVEIVLFGKKFFSFFSNIEGVSVVPVSINMNEKLSIADFVDPINMMLSRYDKNILSSIRIIHNHFVNTVLQVPVITNILPLSQKYSESNVKKCFFGDYLYEPDPEYLINILVRQYIEIKVYYSVMENLFSEQAARMVTMKTATDNGINLLKTLELMYHKVRQNSITQEIFEVIVGASL
ncbi:MAG: ATP synthase F1 complex subunit gamma [Candidatus Westeberhardia cardiocondylae]|nr:ATP synthase F1 complex subunit gamma [Candidatus Westeberhardia cardiocondylae]